MAAPTRAPARQAGFVYLALLMAVVVLGIATAALAEGWSATSQRAKERQLLFVGNQMREALMLYYTHSPAGTTRHPASLEDLLGDPRSPALQRYLRRIYPDPMTGSRDWGLVRGAAGEIYGVYSRSGARPLKQGNFSSANRGFAGAQAYSAWVFMFSPGQSTVPIRQGESS